MVSLRIWGLIKAKIGPQDAVLHNATSFISCCLDQITGEGKFLTAGDLPKSVEWGQFPEREAGKGNPKRRENP